MLNEQMPVCLCSKKVWESRGAQIGHITVAQFQCAACRRFAVEAQASGFMMVLIDNGSDLKSKELFDYLNDVVFVFWRALRENEKKVPVQPEHFSSPTPPKLPRSLAAFVKMHDTWSGIDHDESEKIEVPPDPVEVRHNEFWEEVISDLKLVGPAKKVENGYFPSNGNFEKAKKREPWFQTIYRDATIVFGPRKRVFTIKVDRPAPFSVKLIRSVAKRDDTSYWATLIAAPDDRRLVGGDGWHAHDLEKANHIEVHAWGREKLMEYFGAIFVDLEQVV